MRIVEKPLYEINEEAIILLSKKLGLANTFRFINQFAKGQDDYTLQRRKIYKDKSLDEIISFIKSRKTKKNK